MGYLYETHLHTCEASKCGKVHGEEYMRMLQEDVQQQEEEKYDDETKGAYLEYPDGRREYVGEDLRV